MFSKRIAQTCRATLLRARYESVWQHEVQDLNRERLLPKLQGCAISKVEETMSDNVFFHIGMHKTATTWFQHQFFPSLVNVQVLHTRHLNRVVIPGPGAPTLIVSHAGLSGKLSRKKTPGTNTRWLSNNLKLIQDMAPESAILIGFRE